MPVLRKKASHEAKHRASLVLMSAKANQKWSPMGLEETWSGEHRLLQIKHSMCSSSRSWKRDSNYIFLRISEQDEERAGITIIKRTTRP